MDLSFKIKKSHNFQFDIVQLNFSTDMKVNSNTEG